MDLCIQRCSDAWVLNQKLHTQPIRAREYCSGLYNNQRGKQILNMAASIEASDNIVDNIEIIEKFRNYPCLYNHHLKDHSLRHVTSAAWQKLAKDLGLPEGL
jgi:hypothetical protein